MIISCEKCNKKFELDINLIPETGRLLQCGSCSHQWKYKPERKKNNINQIKVLKNEVKNTETKIIKKTYKSKIVENTQKNDSSRISFLNLILVLIISFFALILIAETFKIQISQFIPNLDFYLSSLYESLKDIFLFFEDLLK